MGIKKILKSGFLGGLNPKKIIGLDSLKTQTRLTKEVYKKAFNPESTENPDHYKPASFEDCLKHYGVTEDGLKKRMHNALMVVYFCLGLSLVTFFYMFYQFSKHFISGGILCLVLTLILWAMSFREHFNLFQMRERRLGCTFKEWFNNLFKKKH